MDPSVSMQGKKMCIMRNNDDNIPSSLRMSTRSFASTFAYWGTLGTFFSLGVLSLLSNHSCSPWWMDDAIAWQELATTSTSQRQRRRMRKLLAQQSSASSSSSLSASLTNDANTTKVAMLMNLPCSEIFQNVLRSNNNTAAVVAATWNMYNEFDDYDARLCDYAKHCIGETPFPELLPLLMCRGIDSRDVGHGNNNDDNNTNNKKTTYESVLEYILVCILLPPALVIYLILLFRLLATTADSYFSPALESFSFELGLPPRFAGATLLALGNGSPDLGSTINSILLWNEVIAKKHAEKIIHDETALNQQAHDELFGQEYENDIYREEGWTMSLGSLAGGGMFVGTIVCGLLIRSCDGITCRFSFIRDVSMYALSVCVVWHTLETGSVNIEDVMLYFGMYLTYITVILVSDLYQRNVTMKKMKEEKKLRRKTFIDKAKRLSKRLSISQSQRSIGGSLTYISNGDIKEELETTPLMIQNVNGYNGGGEGAIKRDSSGTGESTGSTITTGGEVGETKTSLVERLAMLMSNYDPASVRRFSSLSYEDDDDDDEISRDDEASNEWNKVTTMLHEVHPGIHHPDLHSNNELHQMSIIHEADEIDEEGVDPRNTSFVSYATSIGPLEDEESIIAEDGCSRKWSKDLFVDGFEGLKHSYHTYMDESFQIELSLMERAMTFIELPFVALRTACIPVPSEDNYCRPVVALSITFAPCWMIWYLSMSTIPAVLYCVTSLLVGLCVLRYADDEKLPLSVAIPISLYGFFIAATWIDKIAEALVGLLQFAGTISRIPSTILGLTVLSWGNSMGDLSANLAMARKGMPDMATTGCFAGPSFTLLVGIGLGFLNLQHELQRSTITPLSLTPSIRVGFGFIITNCVCIIIAGSIFNWRLPRRYCLWMFTLYMIFIGLSIEMALHPHHHHNHHHNTKVKYLLS